MLAVGQVAESEKLFESLPQAGAPAEATDRNAALSDAIRQLIAAVKFQPWRRTRPPELATEWLAESYYQQSLANLPQALRAARKAVEKSPTFGFGWARVAELEFSFGHVSDAVEALDKGLNLSPRNAEVLAVKGFLLGAQNKIRAAIISFEQAMAGRAWQRRDSSALVDEAPQAYKDIDQVMKDQADLVEIVHELRGILSYKGVEPFRGKRRGGGRRG